MKATTSTTPPIVYRILLLTLYAIVSSSSSSLLDDPSLTLIGRFDTSDPSDIAFDWSGTEILLTFQGTGCSVTLGNVLPSKYRGDFEGEAQDYSAFNVIIDGTLAFVLNVTTESAESTICEVRIGC